MRQLEARLAELQQTVLLGCEERTELQRQLAQLSGEHICQNTHCQDVAARPLPILQQDGDGFQRTAVESKYRT